MRGVNERDPQCVFDCHRDLGGIGKMCMNEIRQFRTRLKIGDQGSNDPVAICGQSLFGQVTRVAAVDALDDERRADPFLREGVLSAQMGLVEPAGNYFGEGHVLSSGQSPHLAENVGDMSAGIFSDTISDGLGLQASTQSDRHNMQTASPSDWKL